MQTECLTQPKEETLNLDIAPMRRAALVEFHVIAKCQVIRTDNLR